jgi:hypothetical protein
VIKHCAIKISKPVIYISNNAQKEGTYPERLKYSLVKPIHKKGNESDVTNYRTISLLIVFFKNLRNGNA